MLDEFLAKLSDEAQLKIALRLIRLALPVWNEHTNKHPDDLEKLNGLIGPDNKIAGAVGHIDADLPARYLAKIESRYAAAKATSERPLPTMKGDVLLSPLFATMMQPITHAKWDETLPYSVRLVYTSVWNVLTWTLFRRVNEGNETHICVAINQAADALMTEKILTVDEINAILSEYSEFMRAPDEETAWENAPSAETKDAAYSMNEVYRMIIGEKIVRDAPNEIQVTEILRQMREEGKSYWDQWEEYYSGTCKTYSYNAEKQSYWLSEADVIVASFFNQYALSEEQMREFIVSHSRYDLRQSGFEI